MYATNQSPTDQSVKPESELTYSEYCELPKAQAYFEYLRGFHIGIRHGTYSISQSDNTDFMDGFNVGYRLYAQGYREAREKYDIYFPPIGG